MAVVLNSSHLNAHAWSSAAMLRLALLTGSWQQWQLGLLALLFAPKNVILMEKGSLPDHFLQLLPHPESLVGTKCQFTVQE